MSFRTAGHTIFWLESSFSYLLGWFWSATAFIKFSSRYNNMLMDSTFYHPESPYKGLHLKSMSNCIFVPLNKAILINDYWLMGLWLRYLPKSPLRLHVWFLIVIGTVVSFQCDSNPVLMWAYSMSQCSAESYGFSQGTLVFS